MAKSIRAGSLAISVVTCFLAGHVKAAELQPKTIVAWEQYVHLTEQRIERELESVNLSSPVKAISDKIVVSEMETLDGTGKELPVPSGMIHHWRGVVLIPSVRLEPALKVIRSPRRESYYEDVLESGLVEFRDNAEIIHLKLQRSQAMVDVAYNTEHRVEYRWHSETFVSSKSRATKIAEIVDLGKDTEHERPAGNDRGFLWRLNAYWKYREVEEGLLVECETLTLSRSVPFFIKFILNPFIDGVARRSIEKTLESLRTQVVSELIPARTRQRLGGSDEGGGEGQ